MTGPGGRAVSVSSADPYVHNADVHGVPVGRRQHVHHGRRAAGRVVEDRQRRRGPDHPRASRRSGCPSRRCRPRSPGLGRKRALHWHVKPINGPGREVRRDRQGLAPRHRDHEPVPRRGGLRAGRRVGRCPQDRGDRRAGPPPAHDADRRALPRAGHAEADPGPAPEADPPRHAADRVVAYAGLLPPRRVPRGGRRAPAARVRRGREADGHVRRDPVDRRRDGDRDRAHPRATRRARPRGPRSSRSSRSSRRSRRRRRRRPPRGGPPGRC